MTLSADQVSEYLVVLRQQLLQLAVLKDIVLTRAWANEAPDEAGVYIIIQDGEILYVGETGNLRGRMRDLLDTRNHIIRRTIGERYYGKHEEFRKATASIKYPPSIESLINEHVCSRLKVSYIAVTLGRKELEEFIQSSIPEAIRLNKRGKRIKRA